jgi:exosortase K
MNKIVRKSHLQLLVVLVCAVGLKAYYSAASPDQLRWILAPTTRMVEVISGRSFQFEAHSGYMSSDHSFLIAASCAGVNFLITSFLVLSLRKIWNARQEGVRWKSIPLCAGLAYLATIVANTLRIALALRTQRMNLVDDWLSHNDVHRLEGILVYFGCLFLLYVVIEVVESKDYSKPLARSLFPLAIYYATTLGIPLLNGAYRQGVTFWEHSLFVLLVPLLLITPLIVLQFAAQKVNHAAR